MWDDWNPNPREYLIRMQSREGHQAGSWSFRASRRAGAGGRVYNTALACLIPETACRSKSLVAMQTISRFPHSTAKRFHNISSPGLA